MTYSDAEYVMFADTLAAYPVQKDVDFISIPVVSTVIKDYDRTFGVEIIDKESNAIETLHYRLESNTVTIKAGENRADVRLKGIYDNIEDEDSLVVCLQLVMNKNLEMPLYGPRTKVELVKVCPFDINDFTVHLDVPVPVLDYSVLSETHIHRASSNDGEHYHLPQLDG